MNLRSTASERMFRQEVRDFLAAEVPPHLLDRHDGALGSTREDTLAWQAILFRRGWGAPHWPAQFGGPGWGPLQRVIFEEECAIWGVPAINVQGIGLAGPVINAFGTDEQRRRLAGPIIQGETYWCQGFSEPDAGSDLAAVRTRARRVGDRYVVNGSKIWTSHAHLSDWIFLLVRTSDQVRKHDGLSFLVAEMKTKGLTVRPIRSIDGLHHLNETFYDDVEIPVENLIGRENEGWEIAKFLLNNERAFGTTDLPGLKRDMRRLKNAAATTMLNGKPALRDDVLATRIAKLEIRLMQVEWYFLRTISQENPGHARDQVSGSILKARASELHQAIIDLAYEVLDDRGALFNPNVAGVAPAALPDGAGKRDALGRIAVEMMYRRSSSIYGGTNEIQRNLIARAELRSVE